MIKEAVLASKLYKTRRSSVFPLGFRGRLEGRLKGRRGRLEGIGRLQGIVSTSHPLCCSFMGCDCCLQRFGYPFTFAGVVSLRVCSFASHK